MYFPQVFIDLIGFTRIIIFSIASFLAGLNLFIIYMRKSYLHSLKL